MWYLGQGDKQGAALSGLVDDISLVLIINILTFQTALKKYIRHVPLSKEVMDIPGGSVSKEPTCNAGDLSSISGSERSPGEGNGNPLHSSCRENPMDRETRRTTQTMGLQESDTT